MVKENKITDNGIKEPKKRGFLSTVFGSLFLSDENTVENDAEIQKAVTSLRAESETGIKEIEKKLSDRQKRRADLDEKLKANGVEIIQESNKTTKTPKTRKVDKDKSTEEMER